MSDDVKSRLAKHAKAARRPADEAGPTGSNRDIGDDRYVKIRARFDGQCADEDCGETFKRGDDIWYDVEKRKVYCADHGAARHAEEDRP